MTNKTSIDMNNSNLTGEIAAWLFGALVMGIGIINSFWGNDPGYGVFIILLSFAYFPPATALIKKITGFTIPVWIKIVLGIFILWSALGVAELFDKIELMRRDL